MTTTVAHQTDRKFVSFLTRDNFMSSHTRIYEMVEADPVALHVKYIVNDSAPLAVVNESLAVVGVRARAKAKAELLQANISPHSNLFYVNPLNSSIYLGKHPNTANSYGWRSGREFGKEIQVPVLHLRRRCYNCCDGGVAAGCFSFPCQNHGHQHQHQYFLRFIRHNGRCV